MVFIYAQCGLIFGVVVYLDMEKECRMVLRVQRGLNLQQRSGRRTGRRQNNQPVRSARSGGGKVWFGVIMCAFIVVVLVCILNQRSSSKARRSVSHVGKNDRSMRDWMEKNNYQNNKELAARKARMRAHNSRRVSR